jgi:hypothetical protein
MENHGINMKGKYFMERVSAPAADPGGSDNRIIFNVSTSINESAHAFGQWKMFYHDNNNWVRPLLANQDDGPDVDNTRQLGNPSYRFSKIYSADFYGQVRYS